MDYLKNNITTLHLKVRPLAGNNRAIKWTRADILNHFSGFGNVESLRLSKMTKRLYGFVKFTQPESAAKAMETKIHTIATCTIEINVAYERHQNRTDTLLDLNIDCLLQIISAECLNIFDLCSLAETCRRLKEVAGEVFRRKWKKCDFKEIFEAMSIPQQRRQEVSLKHAHRILTNFGSVTPKLMIDGDDFSKKERVKILDCVTRHCGDNLHSLTLQNFYIPKSVADRLHPIFSHLMKIILRKCIFEQSCKELFAECVKLVELQIRDCDQVVAFINENTFPNLKHFEYGSYRSIQDNMQSFLSRHKNLQVLKNHGYGRLAELQWIANNCKQLEDLEFHLPHHTKFDFSNLSRLRKLCSDFDKRNFTKSVGWNKLNFLVEIKLRFAIISSKFVNFLPQLKHLQELELIDCTGIQNFNQLENLNQLTHFKFTERPSSNVIDLVRLIQRLGNLKYLAVNDNSLERFDEKTYLQMVETFKRRSNKCKLKFQMYSICPNSERWPLDFDCDDDRDIVKIKYFCDCYDYSDY